MMENCSLSHCPQKWNINWNLVVIWQERKNFRKNGIHCFSGHFQNYTEVFYILKNSFQTHINFYLAVRIDYTKLEMVLKENCTLQKINSEAHANYQHKPHTHLTVLYKIFTELAKLEPGKYLLHYVPKFGQFVALLKECSSK